MKLNGSQDHQKSLNALCLGLSVEWVPNLAFILCFLKSHARKDSTLLLIQHFSNTLISSLLWAGARIINLGFRGLINTAPHLNRYGLCSLLMNILSQLYFKIHWQCRYLVWKKVAASWKLCASTKYTSSVGVRIDHLLFSPIQILLLISLYTTSPQKFALVF